MKFQVNLITIISCAILSTAVPVKDHLDLGNMVGSNRISPAISSYRLPNNSIPLRYDLQLKTDVDKAIFDFSGRVKIHVRLVEDSDRIILNSREMTIINIMLHDVDDTLLDYNPEFEYVNGFELLVIHLRPPMRVNSELVVEISFSGELQNDISGFYRDSYESENERVWLASTQFRPTNARQAFPCFDEPSFMAVFNVEIQHGKRYTAISNTKLTSVTEVEGDYVISKFEDTPLMSTNMLGFVISDYSFVSNNDSRIEQRVYGQPKLISEGYAEFATEISNSVVTTFESFFGVKIPLTKIDHVAFKRFGEAAIENLGLITYPEDRLLIFNSSDPAYRRVVAEEIAHNIAHQLFSGVVTPAWWSYTWLNEAFATLFEQLSVALIDRDSNEDNLNLGAQTAFMADSSTSSSSYPLNFYVESPQDIQGKFGYISHQKGAAVLRMIREVMTPPTFAKGVGYYLNSMAYSPATPSDLHRELQKAFDEDFPENQINLDAMMRTWEDQAGYPVIDIEKYGDKFILTQSRVEYGSEIYSIPISYATKTDPNFARRTPKVVMDTRTIEIQVENAYDWIILNIDTTGFYKVTYDKPIWHAFIDQLKSDHEVISPFHRRLLFRDLNDILSYPYNSFDYIYILDMLSYLSRETVNSVWYYTPQSELKYKLFGTNAYEKYREFQQTLVNPHLRRLGFEPIAGESENDAGLRKTTAAIACDAYELRCLVHELNRITAFVASGEGDFNMCHGLRLANETIHSIFFNYLVNGDSEFYRKDLIDALGCSLDRNLLVKYLELILNETNDLTVDERYEIVQQTTFSSHIGLDVSLDFLRDHLLEITEKFPGLFNNILKTIYSGINSDENMARFNFILKSLELYAPDELNDGDFCILERRIEDSLRWKRTYFYKIEAWLDNYLKTVSK